jgi:flagellar biosynthetic protein FliR
MTGAGIPFLSEVDPATWPLIVLLSARVGGLFLTAPLWSMVDVPKTVRVALVFLISAALVPVALNGRAPQEAAATIGPMAAEMLIGLAIGLTAAAFLHGITLAGEVISIQAGLNLGPALSPMADQSVGGLGQAESLLATSIYVSMGGHLMLLEGLARSVALIPPGQIPDLTGGTRIVTALGNVVFTAGVRAAAPVMVALLITNLALAIMSKAVPQMSAMAVAFPITLSTGLLMFAASLPFFAMMVSRWVAGLPDTVGTTVNSLIPGMVR